RKKSAGGSERIAKHFDRCVDVPKIVWVIECCHPSVAAATNPIAVTGCCPCTNREIFVTEERGCRPHCVDAAEAIVRREFGITAGEKCSHAQMVRRVVSDTAGE